MNSIRTKISLIVGSTVFVFVVLLITANLFVAEPYFTYEKKSAINEAFNVIRSGYTSDSEKLSAMLTDYEQKNGLQIEIFDFSGQLIYTTGRKMDQGYAGGSGASSSDLWIGTFPDGTNLRHFYEERNGLNVLGYALISLEVFRGYSFSPEVQESVNSVSGGKVLSLKGIVPVSQNSYSYVLISTPVTAIEDSVVTFNKLSAMVAGVVLVFGCAVAYVLSDRFTRPIRNVDIVARHVADLDFSMRADERSKDEIGNLARSVNSMSRQLEQFINEIMEKNRRLSEDNERLAKMEQMRREFVANVSHDLKSPLAVIGGYAEMLRDMPGIDVGSCCDIIIDETSKMNDMIKSMLDVSAIEHGLKSMELTRIDLSEVAGVVFERTKVLASKEGVSSDYRYSVQPGCFVMANSQYIEQAMKNYLQNAVAHVSAGGYIEAELSISDGRAVFSVFNTGDRIPEEKFERIWDSFYRVDEARTRGDEGNAGLGLYIVKSIVTAHSGSYGVENIDNGVRFWFSLPLCDTEQAPPSAET